MTPREIASLIESVSYQDWLFEIGTDGSRAYLQVRDPAWPHGMKARKWFLSSWMTKSEIVQTAFKAVLTAVEHEARESFTYCGVPIFGPHFDVNDLVSLAKARPTAGARA